MTQIEEIKNDAATKTQALGEIQTRDRTLLVNLLGIQFLTNYKFAHARDFVCKRLNAKVECKADTNVKVHTTG